MFLLQILKAWCSLNFDENIKNIKKEIIWNNSYIKNNNKTFFYKSLFEKGIKYIDNVFDSRLKLFYTFNYIKTAYALNNSEFLKYHTLVQSISQQWITKLKNEHLSNNELETNLLQQIQAKKRANKYLYTKQLSVVANRIVIKPHIKWEQEIDQDINWKHIHTIPLRSLINTKIRAFQYKYIMRIVPNNKFLYQCKINNTSLCDFCSMNVESNKHLFWECHISRSVFK